RRWTGSCWNSSTVDMENAETVEWCRGADMARKRSQRRSAVRGRADEESVPSYNPVLQAAIYEVVDNQLRDGTPPETRQTLDRLIAEGHARQEARRLIACAVVSEIFNVLQRHEPYDEARYIAALRRLPTMPWE